MAEFVKLLVFARYKYAFNIGGFSKKCLSKKGKAYKKQKKDRFTLLLFLGKESKEN